MATGAVRVSGLRELQRAFKNMEGDLKKELKKELIKAAQPVKQLAESYALGGIRNMPSSPDWADMRIGVTASSVYMVPFRRRAGGSGRPNLKGLLLSQAMLPAVERSEAAIVEGIGQMIDNLADDNGF